jgi:hypothetical protein
VEFVLFLNGGSMTVVMDPPFRNNTNSTVMDPPFRNKANSSHGPSI